MENKNMKNKLEAYKKELELDSSNLSHSEAKTLHKRRIFK